MGTTIANSTVGSDWVLSLPSRDDGFPRVVSIVLDQDAFGLGPLVVD